MQWKPRIFNSIKVLSIGLISGAIALELANLAAPSMDVVLPSALHPVMWIGRFALIAHSIESVIAVVMAPARQKSPVVYSIYTFFVGTVALLELWDGSTTTQE